MSSQEQPEDQQPDDQQPDDAPEAAGAADAPPSEDERIEQVTERIDKARARAEEAGVLDDGEEEEYVESGATEEEDDQTITPPG